MELFDRIYALHRALQAARRPVPLSSLAEDLECSGRTVKRVIERMRDHLGAPIQYSRTYNGYYYDTGAGPAFELPGLWFSAEELNALLVVQQLLDQLGAGLLSEELAPFRRRIERILEAEHLGGGQLASRVRVLAMAARGLEPAWFERCASATLQRRRLAIDYHGRERDRVTKRVISPQRLVRYRDNWYLDAWCHRAGDLRTFAVDRIQRADLNDDPADDLPDDTLDRHFATAYGIFAGEPKATAVLRFTPERARWVADEAWHPDQVGRYLDDGSYELRVPYGDPRELLMDILKHGSGVEVAAPPELRERVAEAVREAAAQYETSPPGHRDTD